MREKLIAWSYPTSTNAKRFGFNKTGCWTLETITNNRPPIAYAGFADHLDATLAADELKYAYSRYSY